MWEAMGSYLHFQPALLDSDRRGERRGKNIDSQNFERYFSTLNFAETLQLQNSAYRNSSPFSPSFSYLPSLQVVYKHIQFPHVQQALRTWILSFFLEQLCVENLHLFKPLATCSVAAVAFGVLESKW